MYLVQVIAKSEEELKIQILGIGQWQLESRLVYPSQMMFNIQDQP